MENNAAPSPRASTVSPKAGQPTLDGVTVCQVIPQLETGGAERTTVEIGRAVVAAGGRSIVVSEGGRLVAELETAGSVHFPLPASSKNPMVIAANGGALARLIKEEGISLLHARSRAPAWSALQAARRRGIPFVTTYHGIYGAKGRLKRLYNSVMARGDAVIANSAYTAAAVREHYGAASWFPEDRFHIIPRGADLARFDPRALTQDRRKAALSAFGGEGAFRILLPGRLTEWKGQGDLLDAARILHDLNPDKPLRVVLAGSAQGRDAYAAQLGAQVSALGLRDMVVIHGHWDDMPAAYDWADVTVSASRRPEAFGRVAVEAQAMGCPVVATGHGGSLETVVDGVTGYLVPPADPEAMAAALAGLMTLPDDDRAAMGDAGRDRAVTLFSIEAMTTATLSVYASLVGG